MSTVTTEMMNVALARFEKRKFFGKHAIDDYGPHHGLKYPEMKYHTSWDWLMPVGKKIRDLLSDMLAKRPPHTACRGDVIEVDITCALHEYDITKVHENIYVFIQWYNSQKP